MVSPSKISPTAPNAKLARLVTAGKTVKSNMGNSVMLAAIASPNLNKTGMLLLLNIGMLINIAPTRKKIRKYTCS
jgi:hypothetical protein